MRIGVVGVVTVSLLGACANVEFSRRLSEDLNCNAHAVAVEDLGGGYMRATGCGDSIVYLCGSRGDFWTSCVEQSRGRDHAPIFYPEHTPPVGGQYGECFSNQTCYAPLECVQNTCLRKGAPGELAGPCGEKQCISPLVCFQGRCEPDAPKPIGAKNGLCFPNETCNPGLKCVKNVCLE